MAGKKKKVPLYKNPDVAPYIYTTKFNKEQDLLFAGGAGKNEFRVFDFATGSLVANISHLPKPIVCGAQANNSSMFTFGSVDSRLRIFSIDNKANSTFSEMSSKKN